MTIPKIFAGYFNLYIIAVFFAFGVLGRFIVAGGYRKLIRQAEDMAKSSHPLMKILKIKFDTCYELKLGVNNVDTFVDKYVYKHKIMGIYLYTWENLCGQSFVFIMLLSTGFGTLAVGYDCGKVAILSTLLVGIGACALLFFIDGICNFSVKREILKIHIKDYLENIYKPRLEKETFYPEKQKEYQEAYFDERIGDAEEDADSLIRAAETLATSYTEEQLEQRQSENQQKDKLKFEFTKEEQSIIVDVIKQYLA